MFPQNPFFQITRATGKCDAAEFPSLVYDSSNHLSYDSTTPVAARPPLAAANVNRTFQIIARQKIFLGKSVAFDI